MPRIIFKCPYIKPGSGSRAANLVEYIATRDGVDFVTDRNRLLPATKKQQELIGNILRDFPDTQKLFEYEDYERSLTIENASELISQVLEQNMHELDGLDYYVKYIAERPSVEKHGEHGLFTAAGERVVISQVQREVSEHTGNIWTPIISLHREDAARLSYDSGRQWQALLRSQAAEMARHMKIHPENFRWYAAFHNEAHHPHIHMVCWSTNPKEGFLTEQGIREIKSGLARQIFRQDLMQIYEQQTDRRGRLNTQSLEAMREMCENIKSGVCQNPELDALILKLSGRLANTGGKKVYGFLKPDVKAIVDQVVDELARDERVAACYDAWYMMREEVLRTYHDEMPPWVPLSAQKEFKSTKNMVIAEAVKLGNLISLDEPLRKHMPDDITAPDMEPAGISFDEGILTSDVDFDMEEMSSPEAQADSDVKLHANWTPQYKQARAYLFGSAGEKPDFEKAFEMFTREAASGNALAMHDLGRMYADGLGIEIDTDTAHQWYAKALSGFLQIESGMAPDDRKATYIRYRIGKMHMAGLGTEQNYTKAAEWLEIAAGDGHKYAQYSLGSLYYQGLGVDRDFEMALGLYERSAAQDNAYADYELAKMYRDGVGTQTDAAKAYHHFEKAYRGFVSMEMQSADDKLQYRIGQMLRDGVGVEANPEEALYYFECSAALGNPHAQYALAKMYLAGGDGEKITAAIELLRKSANGGNSTAQYALGKLYRDGEHVEKDIPRAVELFVKSAEQKNDFAAYALGKIYLAGEDMQKDVSAAIHWFTQSAEQGNQFAQYTLGKIYIMDKDVPRDRDKALHWFSMAAQQGNEYAQFFVDHIDEIGSGGRNPDLFMASARLLQQLGKIFEQQNHQLGEQAMQIDRKRMRILREKKIAQGHARDEQIQDY